MISFYRTPFDIVVLILIVASAFALIKNEIEIWRIKKEVRKEGEATQSGGGSAAGGGPEM